jgi:F0F1-type ATP synthase membrane subunit b/b'
LRNALKKENAMLKEQMATIEQSKQKIKSDLDDAVAKLSQYQELLKASEDKSKELEARLAVWQKQTRT